MKKSYTILGFFCISLNLQAQNSNVNNKTAWERDISQAATEELQNTGT